MVTLPPKFRPQRKLRSPPCGDACHRLHGLSGSGGWLGTSGNANQGAGIGRTTRFLPISPLRVTLLWGGVAFRSRHPYHTAENDPFIKSQLALRNKSEGLVRSQLSKFRGNETLKVCRTNTEGGEEAPTTDCKIERGAGLSLRGDSGFGF